MEAATDLHQSAMHLVEQADHARASGEKIEADALYREALQKECQAVALIPKDEEPTRSILCRSAASIAINCGDMYEALRLVETGLEGNPPDEIAEELKNIQERIVHTPYFKSLAVVPPGQAAVPVPPPELTNPIQDLPVVGAVDKLRYQIQTATEVLVSLSGVFSGATASGIVNIFPNRYAPVANGKSAVDTIKQEMEIERGTIRLMGISLGDFFLDRGNLKPNLIHILDNAFQTGTKIQALIVHPKSDALRERARWEAGPEYYDEPVFFDSTTYIETDGAARIARRLSEKHQNFIEVRLYRQPPIAFLMLTSRFAFFEVYTYAARGSGVPMFQIQAGAPLYGQMESHFSRIWEVAKPVREYQPLATVDPAPGTFEPNRPR